MSLTQTRGHAGHSHSHKHDNTYLTSANKNDAGVRITKIGLFVNLGMAVGKGIGGYMFHSQALVADAFHSLTDLVSDFMTLATVSWSLKPPTARFPTGYGKVESLGALGVSGLLLFGGIGMGLNALDAVYLQLFVQAAAETHEHAHGLFSFLGHDHSHGAQIPDLNAAWLAGGSILVKEWLYRASELNKSDWVGDTDRAQL
jgi:divalent metal cation (Fe/Co/Zn/Cd) transporter